MSRTSNLQTVIVDNRSQGGIIFVLETSRMAGRDCYSANRSLFYLDNEDLGLPFFKFNTIRVSRFTILPVHVSPDIGDMVRSVLGKYVM